MPIMAMYDIKTTEDLLDREKAIVHGAAHLIHLVDYTSRFIIIHPLVMNTVDFIV
ncbi:Uncharacterised protein [uncultured archaeon]|nr:Uncharacterised protein [uncultured archaeon]